MSKMAKLAEIMEQAEQVETIEDLASIEYRDVPGAGLVIAFAAFALRLKDLERRVRELEAKVDG